MEHRTYIEQILFAGSPPFLGIGDAAGIRAGNVSWCVSRHLDTRHTITHSYSLLEGAPIYTSRYKIPHSGDIHMPWYSTSLNTLSILPDALPETFWAPRYPPGT